MLVQLGTLLVEWWRRSQFVCAYRNVDNSGDPLPGVITTLPVPVPVITIAAAAADAWQSKRMAAEHS